LKLGELPFSIGSSAFLAVEAGESEVRLGCQRRVSLHADHLCPGFLSSGRISLERSCLPQGILCLWHVGLEVVGTRKFCPSFARFALLEQSATQPVGSLCVAGLLLCFQPKFVFRLIPLRRTCVNLSQFEM